MGMRMHEQWQVQCTSKWALDVIEDGMLEHYSTEIDWLIQKALGEDAMSAVQIKV